MTTLQSVKVVNNKGYLNSDPALPFMLPSNEFGVNELAQQIQRAAADHDLTAEWENCRILALSIAKQMIYGTYKGGFRHVD